MSIIYLCLHYTTHEIASAKLIEVRLYTRTTSQGAQSVSTSVHFGQKANKVRLYTLVLAQLRE